MAFYALVASLRGGAARWSGVSPLVRCLAVGTLFAVETALDGYTLKVTADAWAQTEGTVQDDMSVVGEATHAALEGVVLTAVFWMTGVAFTLLGLAIVLSGTYPRW